MPLSPVRLACTGAVRALMRWLRHRVERAEIGRLTDRELRDAGLSRYDVGWASWQRDPEHAAGCD